MKYSLTHTNELSTTHSVCAKYLNVYCVFNSHHNIFVNFMLKGKRGLEVDGWEVIFRTRTPREIREEYER